MSAVIKAVEEIGEGSPLLQNYCKIYSRIRGLYQGQDTSSHEIYKENKGSVFPLISNIPYSIQVELALMAIGLGIKAEKEIVWL